MSEVMKQFNRETIEFAVTFYEKGMTHKEFVDSLAAQGMDKYIAIALASKYHAPLAHGRRL